ncbi:sulfatase-like hydrolase/transferase [Natronomonas sp. EA1]|uniref:sulfatase-like hydrolase/transferase n=1 Tax=Natronomonas sp. EA1 TaxID=3421655 RepID=UPI003EB7B467
MEQGSIENIVLFVGDAVRFDASVDQLSKLGETYKSIAGSLHTPASFGSLLTGLNVPAHGITGFQNVLPDVIPSLLDIESVTTAFSDKTGTMHEDMHRIFRSDARASLNDIEPPFVWIVRDPGGHAPFNGYDSETYDQINETGGEYFRRVIGSQETIQQDYQRGVESSISRFEDAIETIQRRGLSDETLLIYTSDHGELLGEYGLLGHNHVACPELVYVPTAFVHPSLEPGRMERTLRNVDIAPTVLDCLGREVDIELDGDSLFEESNGIGYNHFEMTFYNNAALSGFSNEMRSCWDANGGHVFVENSLIDSLAIYMGLLLASHNGKSIRQSRTFATPLRKLLSGHEQYGTPEFSEQEARLLVEQANERTVEAVTASLDTETKERLADLGYL